MMAILLQLQDSGWSISLWLDGIPVFFGHFWPLKLCVERSFLKKLAAFCGSSIALFQALSVFDTSILLDLDTILADSCDIIEIVAGLGLEAASKQNMTFVRSQQELTLF